MKDKLVELAEQINSMERDYDFYHEDPPSGYELNNFKSSIIITLNEILSILEAMNNER